VDAPAAETTAAEPAAGDAPAGEATDATPAEPAAEQAAPAAPAKKAEVAEEDEDEPKIPDDLYRDAPEPARDPLGVASELVTVERSFGYDCYKRNNLNNIALNTIMYAAGTGILLN